MRRRLSALVLAPAAIALLAVPAAAPAAKPTVKRPTITRVTPMRLSAGDTLTLRGRNFNARRTRNTVVFRAPNGRSVFAKPARASRTKLVVRVPTAVARILEEGPTRIRLRVLSRRFSTFTSPRLSPVLVPGGSRRIMPGAPGRPVTGTPAPPTTPGTPAPVRDCTPGDFDGDLLPGSQEATLMTDPCRKDTDGDGMEDGWEYWSAKDLNVKAVPYPGKKPYPNALDGTDARYDFDGDRLTMSEEFTAWVATGRSFDSARVGGLDRESPLGYSDGTQTSRPHEPPAVPVWQSSRYGIPFSPPAYPARLDLNNDGEWSDEERDADGDGMTNFHETHGPGRAAWWAAILAKESVPPWPESYYGEFRERPFADLNFVDPDVDGDSLLDAEDDQDDDGFINIEEMYSRTATVGLEVRMTNAFNPCAPDLSSRICPRAPPIG